MKSNPALYDRILLFAQIRKRPDVLKSYKRLRDIRSGGQLSGDLGEEGRLLECIRNGLAEVGVDFERAINERRDQQVECANRILKLSNPFT